MKMTAQTIMQDMMYEDVVRTHEKKAKKAIINEYVEQCVAEGVDRKTAKVMAEVFYKYGI